jgi:hypothetical protein
MRRSQFCRSQGLSFGTLDRHLKKRRWKRKSAPADGRLVPVELAAKKSPTQHEASCGLAVGLSGGVQKQRHQDALHGAQPRMGNSGSNRKVEGSRQTIFGRMLSRA